MQNPFQDDIHPDALAVIHGSGGDVPSLHGQVMRRLAREIGDDAACGLDVEAGARGGTILVTAPRAGYGKSHLLSRLATGLENDVTVVSARFNLEESPGWDTLLRQTLDAFRTPEPLQGSTTARIRAMARAVFGAVTARLIERGDVPSANPEGAAAGLSKNAQRLFDPGNEDQSVRDWLRNNFEQLRPAMASILAKSRGATESGAAYWLDILKEANECADDDLEDFLAGCLPDPAGGNGDARLAKRRLSDFCRLATLHRPIVFIFDHLDCFHDDPREGLRIAYLLAELRSLSPGQTALLALNDDLWQSAFGERLPSALADRLTALPTRLGPLRPDEARDLIAARCRACGLPDDATARFLSTFDPGTGNDLSPRAVLRRARAAWSHFTGAEEPADTAPESDLPPQSLTDGFPGGMLGDFGAEIPSVAELMDAETLRRGKTDLRDDEEPFPSPGVSPFLNDPEDSYVNGPHSLHSILTSSPPPEDTPSYLPSLKKSGELLASLRGAKGPVPAAPASPTSATDVRIPPPKPPHGFSNGAVHPLVTRFHAFRRARLDTAPSTLSPRKLQALVALCGSESPLIRSSEILLTGSPDGSVLRWILPGQTLLLGFAESDATTFWRAFFLLADDDAYRGAKLVAFPSSDSDFPNQTGLEAREIPPAAREALDIVILVPDTLATLHAAGDLLEDPAAIAPATPGEVLGILADELDFFWRRLTRPLAPAAG